MKKLLIWDFDGTLVDTLTDVAICFNQSLEAHGFPMHPLKAFGGFVGGNLETVVSRMLPSDKITKENIDLVKTTYRTLYLESNKPNTKPYAGIMELLAELNAKGLLSAVNSNKGQLLLDDMVEKLFPAGTFGAVVGYEESRPSKPDPYGIHMICKECGCQLSDAVYIGDGTSDIETAARAGIPCIFVGWGQGTEKDWIDPRNWRCVRSVQELRSILLE